MARVGFNRNCVDHICHLLGHSSPFNHAADFLMTKTYLETHSFTQISIKLYFY